MGERSRWIGDAHEYWTVEYLSELSGARKYNLTSSLSHFSRLDAPTKKAVKEGSLKSARAILRIIYARYGKNAEVLEAKNLSLQTAVASEDARKNTDVLVRVAPTARTSRNMRFSLKFLLSGGDLILTKNMGSRIFNQKYFDSPEREEEMLSFYEEHRLRMINRVLLEGGVIPSFLTSLKEAMGKAKAMGEGFLRTGHNPAAFSAKQEFLRAIRDKTAELLQSLPKESLIKGCKEIIGTSAEAQYLVVAARSQGRVMAAAYQLPESEGYVGIEKRGDTDLWILFDECEVECRPKLMGGRFTDSLKYAGGFRVRR